VLEAVPSSSEVSSRAVCRDGVSLCTIPMNMMLESHSRGERFRWPRRSAVNSRLPKQMVLPGAMPTPIGLLPLAMKGVLVKEPSECLVEKHATDSPSWRANVQLFDIEDE
jgi:hypothetical protein